MAKVGLQKRRDHRPSELSGGEQQRVAIARALITRPTILLADEPTGNLDSKTSGEILELMRGSIDAYGQTTVMVTHDPRAAAIADRILFIADGLIVKELSGASEAEVLVVMGELDGARRDRWAALQRDRGRAQRSRPAQAPRRADRRWRSCSAWR